jgi:hypothetical protein
MDILEELMQRRENAVNELRRLDAAIEAVSQLEPEAQGMGATLKAPPPARRAYVRRPTLNKANGGQGQLEPAVRAVFMGRQERHLARLCRPVEEGRVRARVARALPSHREREGRCSMSHMTEGTLKVRDLDALEEAGLALGLQLLRGQTTHAWYGRFVNDSEEGRRVARERGVASMGTCEHAMRSVDHQGGDYEIGVVKALDGDGYSLMFDSWGPGRKLLARAGADLGKLRQEYALAVATKKAKAKLKGWALERESLPGGRVRLRARKF